MTEQVKAPARVAAEREAEKRERHKPKTLSHKVWRAVHDAVKGWHVALVDDHHVNAQRARRDAFVALQSGNFDAFVNAAGDALLAQCRADLALTPKDHDHAE